MSKSDGSVEIESKGPSHTIVGGDGSPWWIKYSMQAGFMFILILVLWGAYDLFKTKLPTVVEPLDHLAESIDDIQAQTKESAEAQKKQAAALEKIAAAQDRSADAHRKQADAIERWVNQQNFRVGLGSRIYGPPETTPEP